MALETVQVPVPLIAATGAKVKNLPPSEWNDHLSALTQILIEILGPAEVRVEGVGFAAHVNGIPHTMPAGSTHTIQSNQGPPENTFSGTLKLNALPVSGGPVVAAVAVLVHFIGPEL